MWDLFKRQDLNTWAALRAAVDTRFGLTPGEVKAAFLRTTLPPTEDPYLWVQQLDDHRARLGVEPTTCWDKFAPQLPQHVR